ncbi:MAG: hypothetical protein KatS3mg110_3923 [Pirellulaceae bacterium]|nr:MAG: hypothetical protein KatS3mg110_3923 [Pirellulaceae bacterium]
MNGSFRVLVRYWWRESRSLWLTCAIGLFLFCWIRVWIISQLPTSSFEIIAEQLWEKYERFSTVPFRQLISYHGRVALAFDEPIILLGIAIWAIARGSDTVSGKLSRGTMEILLAQPVSRHALYYSQGLVTLMGIAALVMVVWCGIAVGIATVKVPIEQRPVIPLPLPGLPQVPVPFVKPRIEYVPISEKTAAIYFLPAAVNLGCWGVLVAGLATAWSACDRHRGRTVGAVVLFLAVELVLRLVSMASPAWSWLQYFTIFLAYDPQALVHVAVTQPELLWAWTRTDLQGNLTLGPLGCYAVLLVPGLFLFLIGGWYFQRRDLPAPI